MQTISPQAPTFEFIATLNLHPTYYLAGPANGCRAQHWPPLPVLTIPPPAATNAHKASPPAPSPLPAAAHPAADPPAASAPSPPPLAGKPTGVPPAVADQAPADLQAPAQQGGQRVKQPAVFGYYVLPPPANGGPMIPLPYSLVQAPLGQMASSDQGLPYVVGSPSAVEDLRTPKKQQPAAAPAAAPVVQANNGAKLQKARPGDPLSQALMYGQETDQTAVALSAEPNVCLPCQTTADPGPQQQPLVGGLPSAQERKKDGGGAEKQRQAVKPLLACNSKDLQQQGQQQVARVSSTCSSNSKHLSIIPEEDLAVMAAAAGPDRPAPFAVQEQQQQQTGSLGQQQQPVSLGQQQTVSLGQQQQTLGQGQQQQQQQQGGGAPPPPLLLAPGSRWPRDQQQLLQQQAAVASCRDMTSQRLATAPDVATTQKLSAGRGVHLLTSEAASSEAGVPLTEYARCGGGGGGGGMNERECRVGAASPAAAALPPAAAAAEAPVFKGTDVVGCASAGLWPTNSLLVGDEEARKGSRFTITAARLEE